MFLCFVTRAVFSQYSYFENVIFDILGTDYATTASFAKVAILAITSRILGCSGCHVVHHDSSCRKELSCKLED